MRAWIWWVAAVVAGCGSQVTVMNDEPGDETPEVEPPEPPEPDDPPEDEGPRACGDHAGAVTVSLSGGCSFGQGIMEIQHVDAAPEVDGVRIVGDTCTITVGGVGTDVAGALDVDQLAVEYVAEPQRIWIAPLQICPACIPCPCPVPLPLLFAGDGALDPAETTPGDLRTVRVSRGDVRCSVPEGESGCDWQAFELDVSTLQIESGGQLDVAPVLLGTVAVEEGQTAVEEATGMLARSLRANGPSPTCTGLSASEAAWVVF